MTDPTDPAIAVRAFAIWTEHVATLLSCSYADAALFLLKLGPFVAIMKDVDFQEKLQRFYAVIAEHPLPTVPTLTPLAKGVH